MSLVHAFFSRLLLWQAFSILSSMTSLIDSSWERVDEFLPPGIAAEDDSWELVEDSTELVLLDLPHTKQTESSAWSQVPAAPGTSVVLTVRACLYKTFFFLTRN